MPSVTEPSQEDVQSLLKGIKIPSPPQVIADLQMEMFDPEPNLNSIANIISTDPGLSGGILKAANSPAFTTGHRITTVREAVMLLGIQTVDMIVNTLCMRNEFESDNVSNEVKEFMSRFWDSCSDIATISAIVAEKAGVEDLRDDAYLIGLFQNAGIALLMIRFDNYIEVIKKSYAQKDQRIVDIENDMLDTNHAVIGYYVAKSWKLPTYVGTAVAKHHTLKGLFSSSSEDEKVKTLIAIVKVAEHLAGFYKLNAQQAQNYEWEEMGEEVMTFLGMTQDDLDDLASQLVEQGLGCGEFYY